MTRSTEKQSARRFERGPNARRATSSALISVPAPAAAVDGDVSEQEVEFKTPDGWRIVGMLHVPKGASKVPGVVLVHGSRHEADAYGPVSSPGLPQTLCRHGIATLRIDIRGRGASREPREFHSMAPEQRAGVRLDIEEAIKFLVSQGGVQRNHIGVVAEQDTANAALIASAKSRHVATCVLISGRLSQSGLDAIAATRTPVFCLVSKEDRRGLKDMTDVYLLSKSDCSRIKVFEGLALGTTMFSTWRNEFPHEQPIDEMVGDWLAERLNVNARVKRGSRGRTR